MASHPKPEISSVVQYARTLLEAVEQAKSALQDAERALTQV